MTISTNALGPSQVNVQPAIGVAGDFADSNPRASVDAGAGGLISGASGVVIGRFAWLSASTIDADGAPAIVNNTGAGKPQGFVHREQQGLITTYLTAFGMTIAPGFQMGLMASGGYLAKNDGAGQALPGMKAYANLADGSVTFALTGAPTAGLSATASVAASTASVTGSISDNVLTVTAVGAGVVRPGATLTALAAAGTKIVSQLSGTTGGIGTYAVSIPEQNVASGTITMTYGTMTVTVVASGGVALGQTLTGTGVTAGTKVTQFISGTGLTGTYVVDSNTVVSSTADIAANANVETDYECQSSALAGELAKISTYKIYN